MSEPVKTIANRLLDLDLMSLEANQVIKMRNGDSARKYNDQEVIEGVHLGLEHIAWNLHLQMYQNTLFLMHIVPDIYDRKYIFSMFYNFILNFFIFRKFKNKIYFLLYNFYWIIINKKKLFLKLYINFLYLFLFLYIKKFLKSCLK